ncbi:MAG: response regulator transcription factor [Phycisphaerales bacterium]|nr:response regulator transcription factor [Planctomycetota bacterium]
MTRVDAPLRVMCVDDNELLAGALRRTLEREPGMRWAGFISGGNLISARILEASPDVVLMDIDIPGVDVFEQAQIVSSCAPHIRVLMLSGHVLPHYIDRALDSGAWGYLSKNDDVPQLLQHIRLAAQGQIVLSAEAAAVRRGLRSVEIKPLARNPSHPGRA